MKDLLKYFRLSAMALVAALAMSSCGDDEIEKPIITPDVPTDIQGAHFDAENETTSLLFAGMEERSVTYTLTRNSKEGDLTVAIKVISASEGLQVPDRVVFRDGAATAEFVVTAPQNPEEGKTYSFEVEVEGADEFAASGATRFSASIIFPIKHYARMWFTGLVAEYGYFRNDIYEMEGAFIFPNFLESGTDMWVRYDKTATTTVECDLATEPSYKADDEDYPGCYYLYCWQELEDDENGAYTTFYPHGKDARCIVEDFTFYVSKDGNNFTIYSPENRSGYMAIADVYFYDTQKEKTTQMYWQYLNWVIIDDEAADTYDYSEPAPIEVNEDVLAEFAGAWTFTGTDAYCENEAFTPGSSYECNINVEDGELHMTGLLGTALDDNNEETYLVGKYYEESQTVKFVLNNYIYDGATDTWFYITDFTLSVSRNDEGKLVMSNANLFYFYAYDEDWLNASYGSMTFTKK